MAIQSINPANGSLLRSFAPLTDDEVKTKIGHAHTAFRGYSEVPLTHRALWMKKLAGILEHEVEELATLLTSEVGKTIKASRQEILNCAAGCRYYAENAASMLAEESIPNSPDKSYIRWDPLGVVLAVMPCNFPFWQVFRFLAPALMAGNPGLLKHASSVPQCAQAIELLVRRAGFPRGMFQALMIESWQVEPVLADPRVVAVTVTGSESAGRAIAAQAGWLMKKSVLELGASDPFIVMPSADLAEAVRAAVASRCVNNGQSCIAAKRFIIHQDIYDDFELLFAAGMEELKIGDPMKEDTEMGPLATEQSLKALEAQVASARDAGGRVLVGGERMLGQGYFFEPTVIANVPRTAPVYRDEIFGPVAMLFKVSSLAEAVEVANDTPFGLGASIWSREEGEQQQLIAQLECGGVFVNTPVASNPRLPFGGVKRSGYGRELASAGIREFMNAKTVVVAESSAATQLTYDPGFEEALAEPEPPPPTAPEPPDEPASFKDNDFRRLLESAMQTRPDAVLKVLILCLVMFLT